jgi:hypothetical protein
MAIPGTSGPGEAGTSVKAETFFVGKTVAAPRGKMESPFRTSLLFM